MTTPEHLPWQAFLDDVFRWGRGEHLSAVGYTGSGKTYLLHTLLSYRRNVAVLATKPKDSTLDKMTRGPGRHKRILSWPPPAPPELMPKVMVWPKWKDSTDTANQAVVMKHALDGIFAEGEWTIYVDELYYMVEMLGLKNMLRLIWQQGRSLGISLAGATQRPAWVPLEFYSQATHLFLFQHTDKRDLDRIGGIGRTDPETIRRLVKTLDEHVFAYLNTRTGLLVTSKVS